MFGRIMCLLFNHRAAGIKQMRARELMTVGATLDEPVLRIYLCDRCRSLYWDWVEVDEVDSGEGK
jgi:hypothetical protein